MANYHLYELNDKEFEDLVIHICRDLLGKGISAFSEGRDGGRDAKFEGTANEFPDKRNPAFGKFIVQAKSASSPDASCSSGKFRTIVRKLFPSIKKLKENNELDNYLLFTNRKKTGDTDNDIVNEIKENTDVEQVWLRGREDIELYLDVHQDLVRKLKLDRFRSPLRIIPDDLATLITEFDDHYDTIDQAIDSMHNFKDYPGIETKNTINKLSEAYFKYIGRNSEPYFAEIKDFLENPRNKKLSKIYHNRADNFQAKIILKRNQFIVFDEVFELLYDQILEQCPKLKDKSQLVHVFLHYMYCNCDIGESE